MPFIEDQQKRNLHKLFKYLKGQHLHLINVMVFFSTDFFYFKSEMVFSSRHLTFTKYFSKSFTRFGNLLSSLPTYPEM